MDETEESPEITYLKSFFAEGWGTWVSVDDGWLPIVLELHARLEAIRPDYRIYQIKEKFGGLRYYTNMDADPEVQALVRGAEQRAAITCETCGNPGRLVVAGYWYSTSCEEHDRKGATIVGTLPVTSLQAEDGTRVDIIGFPPTTEDPNAPHG